MAATVAFIAHNDTSSPLLHDQSEMVMRAEIDEGRLDRVVLPCPVPVSSAQALKIAAWAKTISGACILDNEIYVTDIKPSSALTTLSDLEPEIAKYLAPLIKAAMLRGFGLRLMRAGITDPYQVAIVRKTIDVPQLSIPWRSMKAFLQALNIVNIDGGAGKWNIDNLRAILSRHAGDCVHAGFAHYYQYALRIIDFGEANGSKVVVWGPARQLAAA